MPITVFLPEKYMKSFYTLVCVCLWNLCSPLSMDHFKTCCYYNHAVVNNLICTSLICVLVYTEDRHWELEPLSPRVNGICILSITAFTKCHFMLTLTKSKSTCFPFSVSIFSSLCIFAKPYVKNNISEFNFNFFYYVWCQKSFHMIKSH